MIVDRVVAAVVALWFVLGGVLGTRHEARIAHVQDRHGHVLHAQALIGAHDGTHSDIHARDLDHDHDRCSLAASLHQAASPDVSRVPSIASASQPAVVADRAPRLVTSSVYRFAPKTSPPQA